MQSILASLHDIYSPSSDGPSETGSLYSLAIFSVKQPGDEQMCPSPRIHGPMPPCRRGVPSQVIAGLDFGDFALLSSTAHERECREVVGFGTFPDAARIAGAEQACPSCRAKGEWRNGHEENELQRFRCRSCGGRYNSPTSTVLEHSKACSGKRPLGATARA